MRYWERGKKVFDGAFMIGHLVHVAILAPHWGGVLEKSLCIGYALHPGGRVFLQRKALDFHWDLKPATFSTTHTQPCLSHLCLLDKKLIVKEDPTLHGSWDLRRSEFQSLDLIGAMDRRKNDVITEIFSQGHEKPLDRGAKNPLTYSARGAKIQLQISHSTDLGN